MGSLISPFTSSKKPFQHLYVHDIPSLPSSKSYHKMWWSLSEKKKILVQLCQNIYKMCLFSKFPCLSSQYFPKFCGMNESLSYGSTTLRIFGASGRMVGWWGDKHNNGQDEGESSRIVYSKGKKLTMSNSFDFMLWSLVSHIIAHRLRNLLFLWVVDCLCRRWLTRQESCLRNSIIQCKTKYMNNVNLRFS